MFILLAETDKFTHFFHRGYRTSPCFLGPGRSNLIQIIRVSSVLHDSLPNRRAEINNIFNQQYEVVQCYPMPGTSFKIKLNVML